MTVCPQAFIIISLTVPLTAEPIKGIILATFTYPTHDMILLNGDAPGNTP